MTELVWVAVIAAAGTLFGSVSTTIVSAVLSRSERRSSEEDELRECAAAVMVAMQRWSTVLTGFDGATTRKWRASVDEARARLSVRLPARLRDLDTYLDGCMFVLMDESDPAKRELLASELAAYCGRVVGGSVGVAQLPDLSDALPPIEDFWAGKLR